MQKQIQLMGTILLLLAGSASSQNLSAPTTVNARLLFSNMNACAANAVVLGNLFEIEFYTNATIDLAFDISDGKIKAAVVRQGIKETSENMRKSDWTLDKLKDNFVEHCGPGITRGYATYYYEQRKNISN